MIGILIIYAALLAVTAALAAKKRTSWFSLVGVAIFPIFFLFVIWDASKKKAPAESSG